MTLRNYSCFFSILFQSLDIDFIGLHIDGEHEFTVKHSLLHIHRKMYVIINSEFTNLEVRINSNTKSLLF